MNAPALPASFLPASRGLDLLPAVARLRPESPRLEGLDAWVHLWQGRWQRRQRARGLQAQGQAILRACQALADLGEAELRQRLQAAREDLHRDPVNARGRLKEALALVGEMASRSLGLRPYAVQFMGALALHRACLAEMATGEGKTLTVALAAALAGLGGRPCHVVTANDYLARRDAQEMAPLYRACGLAVAAIHGELEGAARPACYDSEVVYLTAKELLADHLRDQIGPGSDGERAKAAFSAWLGRGWAGAATRAPAGCLQVRGLHTAIVDEADSILIDEAVTPLILASPRESRGLAQAVRRIGALAGELQAGRDFLVMAKSRSVSLLPAACERLAALAAEIPPLWRPAPRREELLRQAVLVRHFFKPGQQYVVQDGEVVLLDEFTGRLTPGRALTAGLHQAIEAHEGLELTDPNESLTQMSFQAFFSRFPRLAGCTGTGWEAADELWRVYGLPVLRIPTHRPRRTVYRAPRVHLRTADKWDAIAAEVRDEQAAGRPVLVGVRSVGASEQLAQRLADVPGLQVLNALTHAQEAQIVAAAGQAGRVTLATNMAGRGTDIRLGEGVAGRGGLHVIVAEVNDSARVDRQLAGRCARQGDPGSVSAYFALDDELAERMLAAPLRRTLAALAARGSRQAARAMQQALRWAQRQAEAQAFARRWSVLKSDEWMRSALPFGQGGGSA